MTKETFPGGIRALSPQYQKRRSLLTHKEGEELAPLDVDLEALAQQTLPKQINPRPDGLSRVAKKRHMLLGELQGQTELALLHGLVVSHLRKHSYPDHAPSLFRRLWAEKEGWLLDNLPTRWLISAIITFADHGQTEADRKLGQSFNILFSLMKIYEAERAFSGRAPQEPHLIKDRNKAPLPMGMKDFSLLKGDLEIHLLTPLWRDSKEACAAGPLARHLLDVLNQDDGTIFRRFALMRETADDT